MGVGRRRARRRPGQRFGVDGRPCRQRSGPRSRSAGSRSCDRWTRGPLRDRGRRDRHHAAAHPSGLNDSRSLGRGALIITVATGVSRVTGFIRVVVVAAAMGTTFLANTYQTANTAPNVVFELVAAGVLTSVFVPTFVDYLVRGEREKGWDAANALASVALAALRSEE